jgi:transcriptional regulator with XRE-family HTH domain
MNQSTSKKIKSKKLGVLIRDARQTSCKDLEACALAIGVSPEAFQAYELGEKSPSLPELEILAYFLKIPLEHFWGDALLEKEKAEKQFDPQKLIILRQKIIGVLIRKYRMEKELTLQTLAAGVGIGEDRLQAYELGEQPIPLPELEILAHELGWQIKSFQDQRGPVGAWLLQQRYFDDFMRLPPELQEFISKPINQSYLQIAQRMSEMSVDKLRNIAEVLLEITL